MFSYKYLHGTPYIAHPANTSGRAPTYREWMNQNPGANAQDYNDYMAQYYPSGSGGAAPVPGGDQGGAESNFDIPKDAYPQSSSSSHSHSGINWGSPVSSGVLSSLLSSANALPGIANRLPSTIQGEYSNLMRQALSPGAFQGVLNTLAERGVLSGDVAKNALSSAASNIARNIGNQGYQSLLAGEKAKMEVPQILGNLAQLGQENTSSSESATTDKLAPYKLMANLLMY